MCRSEVGERSTPTEPCWRGLRARLAVGEGGPILDALLKSVPAVLDGARGEEVSFSAAVLRVTVCPYRLWLQRETVPHDQSCGEQHCRAVDGGTMAAT